MASPFNSLRKLGDNLSETQWDALRAAAVIVAVAALGAGGYYLGWPRWQQWQNRRALAQAEQFAEKGDLHSLMLSLRRATELEPGDFATWQQAAKLLAQVGSPDTVVAREEMVQLAPEDAGLRLALAQDALKFGRFDTAETALAGLGAAARRDVAFHRLAAALAAALGRDAEVEQEVRAIVAIDPGNVDARYTLAALRIWSPDPAARADAQAELGKLLADPGVRIRAAIELLSQASREGNAVRVHGVLLEMLARFAPGAAADFSAPTVPAWSAILDGMKAAAAPVPTDVAILARWLAGLDRWPEALSWIASLPPSVRGSAPVADTAAEICAEHDDLDRLGAMLRAGAWGSWPEPAQALALASHLQSMRFSADRGRLTWNDAIAACGDSIQGLRNLARLASIWRDRAGEEQALNAVLKHNSRMFWAYTALRGIYLQRQDLRTLWDLYGRWRTALPDDPSVASAWVLLGCVLDRENNDLFTVAEQMHQRFADSVPASVAYAATLWRRRHADEAWSVLGPLPEAVRQRPDVSFWVALVRADLGDRAGTIAALQRARPGATTDAEKEMLREAADKVDYATSAF